MDTVWECKIGQTDARFVLPFGSDLPMRNAIRRAYMELTGHEPEFIFSGWGAELSDVQREVVREGDG